MGRRIDPSLLFPCGFFVFGSALWAGGLLIMRCGLLRSSLFLLSLCILMLMLCKGLGQGYAAYAQGACGATGVDKVFMPGRNLCQVLGAQPSNCRHPSYLIHSQLVPK